MSYRWEEINIISHRQNDINQNQLDSIKSVYYLLNDLVTN